MATLGKLHHDYHGTREWLVGPECIGMIMAETEKMAGQARGAIRKRTGKLAGSTHVGTRIYIGEEAAWNGDVIVSAPRGPRSYAAPHESGWTQNGKSHPGGHELLGVLRGNAI